jgi:DNA processing protein
MITAFQALEQNREVFAVPGPITSGKSSGVNQLLKEGATMVQSTSDIVNELAGQMNKVSHSDARKVPQLKGLEKDVYELLSDEPCHVDFLVQKTKKTSPEVLTVLLTLELLGIVKQLSGKCFIRY